MKKQLFTPIAIALLVISAGIVLAEGEGAGSGGVEVCFDGSLGTGMECEARWLQHKRHQRVIDQVQDMYCNSNPYIQRLLQALVAIRTPELDLSTAIECTVDEE